MIRRPLIVFVAALCGVIAVPTSALGLTVSVSGPTVVIVGAPGESNSITVTPKTDMIQVKDFAPVLPGAGCIAVSPNEASCPIAGILSLLINAGDLNDSVTVDGSIPADVQGGDGTDQINGSSSADTLRGGPVGDTLNGRGGNDVLDGEDGADSINGGAGDDTINSRDLFADNIFCGGGTDRVVGDLDDATQADCEILEKADVRLPGLAVKVVAKQKVVRRKAVVVRAGCNEQCTVSVKISGAVKSKTVSVPVGPNQQAVIKLKLSRAALKKLRTLNKRGKSPLLTVTVTAIDVAGNKAVAVKRRVRAVR